MKRLNKCHARSEEGCVDMAQGPLPTSVMRGQEIWERSTQTSTSLLWESFWKPGSVLEGFSCAVFWKDRGGHGQSDGHDGAGETPASSEPTVASRTTSRWPWESRGRFCVRDSPLRARRRRGAPRTVFANHDRDVGPRWICMLLHHSIPYGTCNKFVPSVKAKPRAWPCAG